MQIELPTLAAAVAKAVPDFDDEQRHIALAVYNRLAEGSPAPPHEIATRAQVSQGRVEELLGSWPGIFRNEDGSVIGFWGLAIHELSPTHRIRTSEGRRLFAWCAWDTLFLPGLLSDTLDVESRCPTTGESITLTVSPSEVLRSSHPEAVVSFLLPEGDFEADVIQSFCHFVHLFVSPQAADAWIADHPGTFRLSLQDAYELGSLVNEINFGSLLSGRR